MDILSAHPRPAHQSPGGPGSGWCVQPSVFNKPCRGVWSTLVGDPSSHTTSSLSRIPMSLSSLYPWTFYWKTGDSKHYSIQLQKLECLVNEVSLGNEEVGGEEVGGPRPPPCSGANSRGWSRVWTEGLGLSVLEVTWTLCQEEDPRAPSPRSKGKGFFFIMWARALWHWAGWCTAMREHKRKPVLTVLELIRWKR